MCVLPSSSQVAQPTFEFYIVEIMLQIFCDFFHNILRSIDVDVYGYRSFTFTYIYTVVVYCTNIPQFVQPIFGAHLVCFQLLAIEKKML